MDIYDAKKIIQNKYKNMKIVAGFPVKGGFVFSVQPKDATDKHYILDSYHKVTTDGKIVGYSPVMDPEEFKAGAAKAVRF